LKVQKPRLADLVPSREEMRASAAPILRGTLIGFLIGVVPGSAHIISSFVSYALEKKISKHPERFGHGAVEGVAGPESANNSATSGAFIPLLALGIPSGAVPAVMLTASAPGRSSYRAVPTSSGASSPACTSATWCC
jgi:putative tricarboxylic transport membrane protein